MRLVRSSAQPLAPQHVSGVLGVQVRVNPEPADPAKPAPSHSCRARPVLELCHGVPWVSATRRHVVPSCDLNSAFVEHKWTSAVLSLISSGSIWYLVALTVLRPLASFSQLKSQKQAVGEGGERMSHVYELKSVDQHGSDGT